MNDRDKIVKKIIEIQKKLFIPVHVDKPERFDEWDEKQLKMYLRANEILLTENV